MGVGNPEFSNSPNLGNRVSNKDAAEMLNVSKNTVIAARKVKEHGSVSLRKAVESGEVSVAAASEVAEHEVDLFLIFVC